ncbi:winged helix-turn-helix domain-containing protein [Phycisphaera mikurensis]|uniref:OmpR/PhoB-type domain-containing protein n=1 Tax=Phycisphaera mikurensis (strain NBRC 102666 / KCTC 22515 / FYK2301M01) TaxID=1142394 RepID=I0IJ42_PHYMF|nr:winged helix-turn-helix domain-containing protein [Phycisphaera mikurensis]MBB6443127.1 DNA-binding response OmpR family regulator [Phycisphaera mikurensis]BAM05280.1 hypothetical protein PSMK_31210 [Phycisphaera mikurensis NBRC 102666]
MEAPVPAGDEEAVLRVGAVVVRPESFRVSVAGERVGFTAAEVRAVALLARRPGWTFSPAQLHAAAHGQASAVGPASGAAKTLVHRLRRKLGPAAARQLQSVRGVGYRLVEASEPGASGAPEALGAADALPRRD